MTAEQKITLEERLRDAASVEEAVEILLRHYVFFEKREYEIGATQYLDKVKISN